MSNITKQDTELYEHHPQAGRLAWTYIGGFVFSVLLTLQAYFFTTHHILSRPLLIASVAVLAIVQLLVQLIFFLHLDREPKPRWNLTVFLFAAMVVIIIGFGSIWIMNNLNYHMPGGDQVNEYIIRDEGMQQ